jgi:hypothetical protein
MNGLLVTCFLLVIAAYAWSIQAMIREREARKKAWLRAGHDALHGLPMDGPDGRAFRLRHEGGNARTEGNRLRHEGGFPGSHAETAGTMPASGQVASARPRLPMDGPVSDVGEPPPQGGGFPGSHEASGDW